MVCRCVVLIPEESEDMWHAYNLISVRDVLKSTTIRFVVQLFVTLLSLLPCNGVSYEMIRRSCVFCFLLSVFIVVIFCVVFEKMLFYIQKAQPFAIAGRNTT